MPCRRFPAACKQLFYPAQYGFHEMKPQSAKKEDGRKEQQNGPKFFKWHVSLTFLQIGS